MLIATLTGFGLSTEDEKYQSIGDDIRQVVRQILIDDYTEQPQYINLYAKEIQKRTGNTDEQLKIIPFLFFSPVEEDQLRQALGLAKTIATGPLIDPTIVAKNLSVPDQIVAIVQDMIRRDPSTAKNYIFLYTQQIFNVTSDPVKLDQLISLVIASGKLTADDEKQIRAGIAYAISAQPPPPPDLPPPTPDASAAAAAPTSTTTYILIGAAVGLGLLLYTRA